MLIAQTVQDDDTHRCRSFVDPPDFVARLHRDGIRDMAISDRHIDHLTGLGPSWHTVTAQDEKCRGNETP
jgi:hypothetical protein